MYEDYVRRAILAGRGYDDLPPRVRASLPPSEWRSRCLAVCISRGAPWQPLPPALRQALPPERDYHEELLARHAAWRRPYPHHLADYVGRVLRVTPFSYYTQMLAALLAREGAYSDLPNLTARDATAHTGVGRNAFIAALNGARGRRLLWRVNKAAAAREALPARPADPTIVAPGQEEEGEAGEEAHPSGQDAPLRVEPWWVVSCVNVMEHELRDLSPAEVALLRRAAADEGGAPPLLVGEVSGASASSSSSSSSSPSWLRYLSPTEDPRQVLIALWKRGLVYFGVPVQPSDRFRIPPLDSFISNRSSGNSGAAGGAGAGIDGAAGGGVGGAGSDADLGGDPREALLQAVLVASHARLTAADLADALGAEPGDMAVALSLACRLGFARRVMGGGPAAAAGQAASASIAPLGGSEDALAAQLDDSDGGHLATAPLSPMAAGRRPSSGGGAAGHPSASALMPPPQAAAVVVDTSAAGLLMMGALSPGLKRHSVTLFEGGRVAADAVSGGLIRDLRESHAAGVALDGELKRLTAFAASLAALLEAATGVVGGGEGGGSTSSRPRRPVEILRAETLAGLDPGAARRVLGGAYYALVPIAPLPGPPLPLSPGGGGGRAGARAAGGRPTPVSLGPCSPEAASPWLQMLLYAAAGSGPTSLALVRGQRLAVLPPALRGAKRALLWPWDHSAAAADPTLAPLLGASGGGGGGGGGDPSLALGATGEEGEEEQPHGGLAAGVPAALVDGGSGLVLAALNRMLTRTAVMVQAVAWEEEESSGAATTTTTPPAQPPSMLAAADVPLPLPAPVDNDDGATTTPTTYPAVCCATGRAVAVAVPLAVAPALGRLGVDGAVGFLRVVRLDGGGAKDLWAPLAVCLGVPLYRPSLCREVCARAAAADFLSSERVAAQGRAQRRLQRALAAMARRFGSSGLAPAAAGRDDAAGAAAPVDLPARNLLFGGGHELRVVRDDDASGVF